MGSDTRLTTSSMTDWSSSAAMTVQPAASAATTAPQLSVSVGIQRVCPPGGEPGDDQWQAVFEIHKIVRHATGWGGDLDDVVAFGQHCCLFPEHEQGRPANFGMVRESQFGDGSREYCRKIGDELHPSRATGETVQHLAQGSTGPDHHQHTRIAQHMICQLGNLVEEFEASTVPFQSPFQSGRWRRQDEVPFLQLSPIAIPDFRRSSGASPVWRTGDFSPASLGG